MDKKKKSEELLVDLEAMIDKLKKQHKDGQLITSKQVALTVDRLLTPYCCDVELRELKGDWSPVTNVKWDHFTDQWNETFCEEVFFVSFEVTNCPLRAQFRHRCGQNGYYQFINMVAAEAVPHRHISWHRLTPLSLLEKSKTHLWPVLHAIISEHSAKKTSLNLNRLKHAIENCKFE
jgi:hypothetical protein